MINRLKFAGVGLAIKSRRSIHSEKYWNWEKSAESQSLSKEP